MNAVAPLQAHPAKPSTTEPLAITSLGWLLRTVGRVSPGASAQLGARVFCSPRRRKPGRTIANPGTAIVCRSRGIVLHGQSWGSAGPTILLAHGWEGHIGQLAGFVQPLLRRGYRVVAFDAPGHDASRDADATLVANGQDIADIAHQLGPLHGIVAHSFGASSALWAASSDYALPPAVFIAPAFAPCTPSPCATECRSARSPLRWTHSTRRLRSCCFTTWTTGSSATITPPGWRAD